MEETRLWSELEVVSPLEEESRLAESGPKAGKPLKGEVPIQEKKCAAVSW